MVTALSSSERNYKKLPLSKEYYDLKDRGNLSGAKKVAKKVLQPNGPTPASSSLSSSASLSSTSSSSSTSQKSISKVSQSILSKGSKSATSAQGDQIRAGLSSLQTPAKKEGEEIESAPITTKPLDLPWLKKNQRTLLLTLFKEYALDDEIRLYDLLGLHIHNLLKEFRKSLKSITPIDLQEMFDLTVMKEFHQRYLFLYVSLKAREKDTCTDKLFYEVDYDKLDTRHVVKRGSIPSHFSMAKENLDVFLPLLKAQVNSLKYTKSAQEKLKAKLLEKDLGKIELQLAQIHNSLELMQAFLANDARSQSLLSFLYHFAGSETIPKNPQKTRDSLINWMQFISQASFDLAESQNIFNLGKLICNEPLEYLPNLITKKQMIDKSNLAPIHKWYKEIALAIQQGFFSSKANFLKQVIDKNLSYEQYCGLEEMTPKKPYLTHDQVVSMLFQACNHAELFSNLVYDFVRIMENNILSPLSKGTYVTFSDWIEEISEHVVHVSNSPTSMVERNEKGIISTSLAKSLKGFDKHLQEGLTALLDELKKAFSEESLQSEILEAIEMAQINHKSPVMIYIVWMNFLPKLKAVLDSQSTLFDRLRDIRRTSLSKLKSQHGVSLEDQYEITNRFRKSLTPFLPYIWLMNDVQILLDGRELDITKDERLLPIDLLDLLTLNEEDFPRDQLQDSEKVSGSTMPVQEPSIPKPNTNPSSALTRKEIRELEELSQREPRKPTETSPDELQQIRKRKELLKYLTKQGFLQTDSKHRGSHMVFKDPTKKTTVVVPKGQNDRLAPGTMHAIKQQVQPGKKSETIVIQKRIQKTKKKGKGKNKHKSLEGV